MTPADCFCAARASCTIFWNVCGIALVKVLRSSWKTPPISVMGTADGSVGPVTAGIVRTGAAELGEATGSAVVEVVSAIVTLVAGASESPFTDAEAGSERAVSVVLDSVEF